MSVGRITRAVVVAMVLALLLAPSALAHDTQIDSVPSAGAVLDEPPAEVSVEFDAPLMDVGEALVVRDAQGTVISEPAATVTGRTISTTVRTDVPPGEFTVGYRIVSQDGHAVTSSFTYTVAGEPGPSLAPDATPGSPAASPSPPVTAIAQGDSSSPPYLLIAVGTLVLIGLAVGALALSR
jgi:methionine-rich copper-binding protein CopC